MLIRSFRSAYQGISPFQILRAVVDEIINGSVMDLAAQLSYFFLFALFPLLFFLVALTPYLPVADVMSDMMAKAALLLPHEAFSIIKTHMDDLLNNPRPKLLSFSLLLALWSASRGVNSFRIGLNLAYGVTDKRPFWRVQLLCIGLMLLTTLLVITSSMLMLLGGRLGVWILGNSVASHPFILLGSWLRWPLGALAIATALGLNYYFLPDVKQKIIYLLPGALLSTTLWLLFTWGFTQYVEHLGNYNATYGSIGGVVVLMTWLYLTGLIFLIGGKLNALIEHASENRPGVLTATTQANTRSAGLPRARRAVPGRPM